MGYKLEADWRYEQMVYILCLDWIFFARPMAFVDGGFKSTIKGMKIDCEG